MGGRAGQNEGAWRRGSLASWPSVSSALSVFVMQTSTSAVLIELK